MLSIIIPVKPPEPFLPKLIEQLTGCVPEPFEVLIQKEKGLGYAVMCGVIRAKGDVVCVLDADGSHDPLNIPKIINLLETQQVDIVVGSRYAKGGCTSDSVSRQLISRVYCLFAQALFQLSIRDNMSGFVVAKREVFLKYPIQNRGFKFGLELLCRSRHSYRATEYPICFSNRKAGKSKASALEAVRTFGFMLNLLLKANFKA